MKDDKKYIKSFCGRQSRTVSCEDEFYLKSLVKSKIFDIKTIDLIDFDLFKNKKLLFEVGFGDGKFIQNYTNSAVKKDCNILKDFFYIGCDIYKKGALNIVNFFESIGFENYIIFFGDGRYLLEEIDSLVDNLFLLYPDPWPKNSHVKRRIFSEEFLNISIKSLKKDGNFSIATDHYDYYLYIRKILERVEKSLIFKESIVNNDLKYLISKNTYALKALYGKESYFINLEK